MSVGVWHCVTIRKSDCMNCSPQYTIRKEYCGKNTHWIARKKRKERDARHHAKVIWKLNLNCVENGEKACFYKINLISSSYLFLLYARSNKSHIYTSSLFPPIIPYNAQHKFFICFKWNENSTWGYNILMWTCIITFAS